MPRHKCVRHGDNAGPCAGLLSKRADASTRTTANSTVSLPAGSGTTTSSTFSATRTPTAQLPNSGNGSALDDMGRPPALPGRQNRAFDLPHRPDAVPKPRLPSGWHLHRSGHSSSVPFRSLLQARRQRVNAVQPRVVGRSLTGDTVSSRDMVRARSAREFRGPAGARHPVHHLPRMPVVLREEAARRCK